MNIPLVLIRPAMQGAGGAGPGASDAVARNGVVGPGRRSLA